MKILKNLLVFLFVSTITYSQQLGVWKNYSNLQKIRDAYATDKGVWAVCQGGAFYFNFEDSSFSILNKAEGLSNNLLSAVTLDPQGKIWFGSQDGFIDVYNPATKEFKRILEITNSNRINKTINEFYVNGDTIFVSTDFGLSLINSNTLSFYESCAKFGDFDSDTKVFSSFKDQVVYVNTQSGLAIQKSSLANFSAPESWNNFRSSAFQSAGQTIKTLKYHDTLFTATDRGLFYFNGLTWLLKSAALSSGILDMIVKNDSLFLITANNQINLYSNGNISNPFPGNSYKRFVQGNLSGRFLVITDNGLLDLNKGAGAGYIFPNGPKANTFSDMAIDKNGSLYVASGRDAVNLGYYKFDGSTWYNYNVNTFPGFVNNSVYKVYISPDNNRYLGTWGNGMIRLTDKDTTIYTASSTGMSGIPTAINFLVVSGIINDSKGNLWVVNFRSASKQPISKLSTNNVWTHFTNPLDLNVINAWGGIVIDNNNTKWFITSSVESTVGQYLYYLNDEKPLYSSDVDGWGRVTSDDGLTTGSVKALAIGRRGELWVGTTNGVSIIEDPSQPKAGKNITTVYLLNAQNINAIAVDALNQKWIGTDKGVFIMSSDGQTLLNNFTSENSPLPSNSITSIAIDNNSGVVYIGTDFGLASVTTNSVNPQENLNGMFAYPNPAIINNDAPVNININGLVRDSEIKIFSISGKLVVDFPSPGAGIATWDGKDASGNFVPSGIYLIVAFDKDGNNVGTTKVAVVKK